MGLLSRLREWLVGAGEGADDATGSEPDEQVAEEPRLDPENVAEVHTESKDDPVEKLREVRDDRGDGKDE